MVNKGLRESSPVVFQAKVFSPHQSVKAEHVKIWSAHASFVPILVHVCLPLVGLYQQNLYYSDVVFSVVVSSSLLLKACKLPACYFHAMAFASTENPKSKSSLYDKLIPTSCD